MPIGPERSKRLTTSGPRWVVAAARYRTEWVPQADWIELEGVGHCPQLDVPLETAQLILGFTS